MSLSYYIITNHSADLKQFAYTSGSSEPYTNFTINVLGNSFEIVESGILPYNLGVGTSEIDFLSDNFYPSPGYAYLWNDGVKVKYIKINHESANNENIGPFINNTNIISFLLIGALDASGNYLVGETSQSLEDYQLSNSTEKPEDYNLLNVDQDDPITSYAVDALNGQFQNFNFSASGNFIWYATASGRSDEPISSSGYTESRAQGYFPVNIEDFGSEQFFRGWASASYYYQDDLTEIGGVELDFLDNFNTGSSEKDNDNLNPYVVSQLPWFMNAQSSSFKILSESFDNYTNQNRIVSIGPRFTYTTPSATYETSSYEDSEYDGDNTQGQLAYLYKEDTNEILINDPNNILTDPKSNILTVDSLRNSPLIDMGNPQTYVTTEGHEFVIKEENQLWVYRGYQPSGTGDNNAWNYNRYLHRPYKIYMVTTTGSNNLPSHFEKVFVSFSSSLSSERPTDGAYIFNSTLVEQNVALTASINLTSSRPYPVGGYETASYDNFDEYNQTPDPAPSAITWETASLNLYIGNLYNTGSILQSQSLYINDINSNNNIVLNTLLTSSLIFPGTVLRLSLLIDSASQSQPPNSSLLVSEYSMSISASTPLGSDLVPTYLDNILQVTDDCNPIVGNALNGNPNNVIMQVDYSSGSVPVNFNQIISNTAIKAQIPNSNYSQRSSITSKYYGSKSTSEFLNYYTAGDVGGYGKIPNISLNKAYSAYFNRIYETYPLLNNKTAFEIKYVIDENGNAAQPRISDFTYYNLEGSLSDQEIGKISITDKQSEVLYELNGKKSIFKTGKKPVPILYSQISANTYTSSLYVLGDRPVSNEPASYNDYTVVASSIDLPGAESVTISDSVLQPNQTIFTGSAINFTASYDSANGRRFFPPNGASVDGDDKGPNGAGVGQPLSDAYEFIVENAIEASYPRQVITVVGEPVSYSHPIGVSGEDSPNVGNIKHFIEKNNTKVPLEVVSITCDALYSNPSATGGVVEKSFDVEAFMSQAITFQEGGKVLNLKIQSDWVRSAFQANGFGTSDYRTGGNLLRVRWKVKYKARQNNASETFKQGDSFQAYYNGAFAVSKKASEYQTYFYPANMGAMNSVQNINFTSQAASSAPTDALSAPYWVWPTGSDGLISDFSVIELVPLNGNITYGREGFKQSFTPYNNGPYPYYPTASEGPSDDLTPSSSITPYFPSGREPDFVRFPQVKHDWNILPGDEFRFENDERFTYTVANVITPSMTNTGDSIAAGKLKSNPDALLNSVTQDPINGVSGSYTGITLNADTGSGANNAIATIELDSPTNISSINLTTTGSGYIVGDVITIPSSSLGNAGPDGNDSKITLQNNDLYGDPQQLGSGVRVYFDRAINSTVDLDFFLIRRYIQDEGTILINQRKPYEVPESPNTATGLIFPEFPVRELSVNPDEVLRNLLEQKLIE